MYLKRFSKKVNDQKGQAFFELVLFLPLLIVLFFYMIAIGSAINGSINQQKTLRGYFYFYIKGNSKAPSRGDVETTGTSVVELMTLGWQEDQRGDDTPLGPCYPMASFFGEIQPGETCNTPNHENFSSQFIGVYTAYGFCGESYEQVGGNHFPNRGSFSGCVNQ